MLPKKKRKDCIEISIGKKDYIYLAILFIVIIAAVCVSIFVPRYYKQKYLAMQQTTSEPSNTSTTTYSAGTNCTISQVINLIKDLAPCYANYSALLANDNTLITNYIAHEHFVTAEALAEQILPSLTLMQEQDDLTVASIMNHDNLLDAINKFCEILDNMK